MKRQLENAETVVEEDRAIRVNRPVCVQRIPAGADGDLGNAVDEIQRPVRALGKEALVEMGMAGQDQISAALVENPPDPFHCRIRAGRP
jgi:hypothetical protein